jgi:hypothetical protein
MDSIEIKNINSLELLDIYKEISSFLKFLDREIVDIKKLGDNHE